MSSEQDSIAVLIRGKLSQDLQTSQTEDSPR